jgi:hypothetical protein
VACFGIEGIDDFSRFREFGPQGAEDQSDGYFVWDITGGLDDKLREGGHTRRFYNFNDWCWEVDLRDASMGGEGKDHEYADGVDLFFICTHGNCDSNGRGWLQYNIKRNEWQSHSSTWRLGNNFDCEWLLIYGCKLVDRNRIIKYWDTFQGLHEICTAWDTMWGWFSTDECGRDVGDNLIDGDSVSDSWIDGVSDWFLDNHPIVIAAETRDAFDSDNESVIWSETTMNNDHFWGHGFTVNDVTPSVKFMLSYRWAEG